MGMVNRSEGSGVEDGSRTMWCIDAVRKQEAEMKMYNFSSGAARTDRVKNKHIRGLVQFGDKPERP